MTPDHKPAYFFISRTTRELTMEGMLLGAYEDENGCWVWFKGRNKGGYGQLIHRKRRWMAHRLAWTLVNGEIPQGLTIDHLCYQPACINTDHMRLLPMIENATLTRRTISRTCAKGHEFDDANTRLRYQQMKTGMKVHRVCRACENAAGAKKRAKRAAAALADAA